MYGICIIQEHKEVYWFSKPLFCLYSMQTLTKSEVRKSIGKILRSLSPESRLSQSVAITNQLCALDEYKSAKSVALFLSMKTEVDTHFLMEDCFTNHKNVLVPKILSDCEFELVSLQSQTEVDALPKDKWGIPIPVYDDSTRMILHPETTPEVIVVPGVAFDSSCKRMGHGKGYYGICNDLG